MIATIAALALAAQAAGGTTEAGRWTWSYYERDNSVALANEIPDTDSLRTVLECEPHSGVAKLSLYGLAGGGRFVRLSSGEAGADAPAEAPAEADDPLTTTVRVDHPVFRSFVRSGQLAVGSGEDRREIAVPRAHLPKLARLEAACAG